jgi:hypothetical protein
MAWPMEWQRRAAWSGEFRVATRSGPAQMRIGAVCGQVSLGSVSAQTARPDDFAILLNST